MATDTADGRADHIRGLTVTTLAAVVGILSAVVGHVVAAGPQDQTAVYVLLAAIVIELGLLQASGIKEDFGAKDVLFVAFMTFSLWFISSTILLTAGVTL